MRTARACFLLLGAMGICHVCNCGEKIVRMSLFCAVGGVEVDLSADQLKDQLTAALVQLGAKQRVLAVPPDITRFHSQAGLLTRFAGQHYGNQMKSLLRAIGTNVPMQAEPIERMFGDMPQ